MWSEAGLEQRGIDMANISVSCDVDIKMPEEEKETVKKAYKILNNIKKELRQNDADETAEFDNVSTACDCIKEFMKYSVGVFDLEN